MQKFKADLAIQGPGVEMLMKCMADLKDDPTTYDLLKAYLKDEEEDLYWSQGAMELIEKIGTQNWLPKDRKDNKYPTLFSSQGYILRRFRNWANPSNYSAPSR